MNILQRVEASKQVVRDVLSLFFYRTGVLVVGKQEVENKEQFYHQQDGNCRIGGKFRAMNISKSVLRRLRVFEEKQIPFNAA
jgi:hypothetical protein